MSVLQRSERNIIIFCSSLYISKSMPIDDVALVMCQIEKTFLEKFMIREVQ